jgi:hypothetical protein
MWQSHSVLRNSENGTTTTLTTTESQTKTRRMDVQLMYKPYALVGHDQQMGVSDSIVTPQESVHSKGTTHNSGHGSTKHVVPLYFGT